MELQLADYDRQRHTDALWYSQKILKLPMLWVGVNPDGEVCYTEGLADHRDNDLIAKWFPRCPLPQPGELLIEGSYVPPQHRNKGVFTGALLRLANRAADLGYRRIVCHIPGDNHASIKAHLKAGFTPYEKLTVKCRCFFRSWDRRPDVTGGTQLSPVRDLTI